MSFGGGWNKSWQVGKSGNPGIRKEEDRPTEPSIEKSTPTHELMDKHREKKTNPHKKEPRSMLISVINNSKRVSDADVQAMVEAVGIQLANDVSPIWGMVPALEFIKPGGTPKGLKCVISDEPDVPGAAGYHDEGPDGLPYIKVFTFEGAPTLFGADALSVTLSHEIIELTLDAAANLWATNSKDNKNYAREGCDAPEAQTYVITTSNGSKVSVSNFLYPGFFDPQVAASVRLDHMGKIDAPFSTPLDGYQLFQVQDHQVEQVFGHAQKHRDETGEHIIHVHGNLFAVFGKDYPEHKKANKLAKAARRRGKAGV